MKAFVTAAVLLTSLTTFAQDMFVIKKSMNPKNVLHYKANIEGCKLKSPAVVPFWTMGEEDGHIESLSGKETAYFAPKDLYEKGTDADFSFGAIEKMGEKIPDKTIQIRLENCKPKAFLDVDGQEIQLTEIYVNVSMFMSVKYMKISGLAPNGQKISRKIDN